MDVLNVSATKCKFATAPDNNTKDKMSSERCLTLSSSLEDNEIVHITIPECSTHLSVTTVLNYCKSKILKPYLRFLSFMGLRSFLNDEQEAAVHRKLVNTGYLILAMAFMIAGYVLQYMSCFRRERGFSYMYENDNKTLKAENLKVFKETCEASIVFSFIVPCLLHFFAYVHIIFVFRTTDDDQLPILMERVFLASTNISNGFISQRKLVRALRIFLTIGLIWLTLSFTVVNYMMANGTVYFKWIKHSSANLLFLKILLVAGTLWHDLIQCTIISNYCLQAQLLTSYVRFMRDKLLQCPVQPLEWMRDIEDFKKLLCYFNQKISPSVCLLIVMDLSFALSGILWIFRFDLIDQNTLPIYGISVLNVLLWSFIGLAPFFQAARLSNACEVLNTVGQEVRARPYVHQDTPTLELDSILLYTTSLKINASLFYIPINGRKIFFFITIMAIFVLSMGQCHYLIRSGRS